MFIHWSVHSACHRQTQLYMHNSPKPHHHHHHPTHCEAERETDQTDISFVFKSRFLENKYRRKKNNSCDEYRTPTVLDPDNGASSHQLYPQGLFLSVIAEAHNHVNNVGS